MKNIKTILNLFVVFLVLLWGLVCGVYELLVIGKRWKGEL